MSTDELTPEYREKVDSIERKIGCSHCDRARIELEALALEAQEAQVQCHKASTDAAILSARLATLEALALKAQGKQSPVWRIDTLRTWTATTDDLAARVEALESTLADVNERLCGRTVMGWIEDVENNVAIFAHEHTLTRAWVEALELNLRHYP